MGVGLVYVYQLPADARFGMWMEFSAVAAEESGVGLWGSCEAQAHRVASGGGGNHDAHRMH